MDIMIWGAQSIALGLCKALKKLNGCEAHATYIVDNGDKKTLKSLKINLSCEPEYMLSDDANLD